MSELMRWEYGDPARILERRQEMREAARPFVKWADIRVDPFGAVWFGGKQAMTRDESEQIETLVMHWYRWTSMYRPHLSGPRMSAFAREAASDYVHESREDMDARLEAMTAEQVDVCIDALRWQLRSAIGIHAANKAAGNQVYENPRMTRDQQHAAYQEAKAELLRPLIARGLVKKTEDTGKTACAYSAIRP